MNSIYSFNVEYWNANNFIEEGEKKTSENNSNRVCQI